MPAERTSIARAHRSGRADHGASRFAGPKSVPSNLSPMGGRSCIAQSCTAGGDPAVRESLQVLGLARDEARTPFHAFRVAANHDVNRRFARRERHVVYERRDAAAQGPRANDARAGAELVLDPSCGAWRQSHRTIMPRCEPRSIRPAGTSNASRSVSNLDYVEWTVPE